jgi:hypothetical protein
MRDIVHPMTMGANHPAEPEASCRSNAVTATTKHRVTGRREMKVSRMAAPVLIAMITAIICAYPIAEAATSKEAGMAPEHETSIEKPTGTSAPALTAETEATVLENFAIVYMFKIGKGSREIGILSEVEEKASTELLKWMAKSEISESMILRFVGSNDFSPQYKKGEKGYYFGVVLREPIPGLSRIPNYGSYFPRDGSMIIEDFHGGLFASRSSTIDIKSAWMKTPEEAYVSWLGQNGLVDYFGKRQCLEEYIPVTKDPKKLLELPYEKRWTEYKIYIPVEKKRKAVGKNE